MLRQRTWWWTLRRNQWDTSPTMATFAVAALPTTVVIDRSGRIVLHLEAAADEAALARAAFGHTESRTTK